MAVGGMGMLSTSNYAARKFGVRAAMPGMGVYWLLFVFSENVFNFVKIYIKSFKWKMFNQIYRVQSRNKIRPRYSGIYWFGF